MKRFVKRQEKVCFSYKAEFVEVCKQKWYNKIVAVLLIHFRYSFYLF